MCKCFILSLLFINLCLPLTASIINPAVLSHQQNERRIQPVKWLKETVSRQVLCNSDLTCNNPSDKCLNPLLNECRGGELICFCLPDTQINICMEGTSCPNGNVCVNSTSMGIGQCVACADIEYEQTGKNITIIGENDCAFISPGVVADDTCVDATLLQHLPADQLVFESHRRSAVLCDEDQSCATLGHIVQFQGKPMMMKTYCQLHAHCVQRVIHVNSPKMVPRLRIQTRTKDLLFTPLSASHQSRLEERLLSVLLRTGF